MTPPNESPQRSSLQAQLAELEQLYRNAPIGLGLVDCELRYVRVNERLAAIVEKSVAEHIGRNVREVIPHLADQVEPCFHAVIERGKPVLDAEITRPNSDQTWLTSYYPLRGADGTIIGANVIVREVTKYKRAEQQLQVKETSFRALVENSPAIIYIKDATCRHVYVNRTTGEYLDVEPEKCLGTSSYDCFPAEVAEELEKLDRRILAGELENSEKEFGFTFRGKTTWLRDIKFPIDLPTGERLVGGIAIDMTERQEAKEALEKSEKQYRDLVENANSVILHWDADGNILFMNPYGLEFFGYKEEELIGRNVLGTIVPKTESTTRRDLALMMREIQKDPDKYTHNENENMRKDGKRVWLVWANKAIAVEGGSVLEVLSIGNDITERIQAEEELRKREGELEAKNIKLEEMNAALKVLLDKRDEDKTEIEKRVVSNVKELVLPALSRLKNCDLDARQEAHLDVLESSLAEIISPFLRSLFATYSGLTPTEITVANLVKEGKDTKEIAAMIYLSKRSVETYRMRLRKKLGINNKKVNLRTYLLSLQ